MCSIQVSLIPFLQKMPILFHFRLLIYPIYSEEDTLIYLPRFLSLIYLKNSLLLDLEYPSAKGIPFSFFTSHNFKSTNLHVLGTLFSYISLLYKNKCLILPVNLGLK